ncbi:MAG TPA: YfhO family protein [Verrucomicrobiae bacterium]|jgi:hypothetical protein
MSDPKSNDAGWLTTRSFLLLLAAALFAAFPQILLGTRTFFYRDFGALGYPGAVFNHDSLLRGELPLWDPYSHCGVPWLAQMGSWYPVQWLCYFLPLPWSENFVMLVHLWFGGFGMFWLLRRWNLGNYAAAFGAFAFIFNGVTLSCLQWGNYIASLAWLPWILGCVIESWRNGGRWLPLAAIASAMQVLTATPEITLLTWLFLGMIWLSEVIAGEIKFLPSALRTIAVVLLAAGITMIQMLPFFDLLAHSQRSSGSAGSGAWSMPAWGWANLIVPLFHCYRSPQGTWFQNGQDFLQSYYLGAGVLALAITGAIARNRKVIVIAVMILFCWLMALGPNGIGYNQIKEIFPLIGIARFPVKFTILTAFLVPLLAAYGIKRLQSAQKLKSPKALFLIAGLIVVIMAALLCLAKSHPMTLDDWNATAANTLIRAGLMLVLVGGIFCLLKIKSDSTRLALQLLVLMLLPIDALTHSPNLAPTLPSSALAPQIWQASGKSAPPQLGGGRIMVSPNAEQALLYSRVPDMNADFTGKRLAEWYNMNLLDGIPKVTGAVTLRPAYFDVLETYLYYTPGAHCGRGLVDFLSAAWLSSPNNPTEWLARTNYLPLITAGQKPIFTDNDKTLSAITDENFDPRQVVYLTILDQNVVTATNQSICIVTNTTFTLNKVEANVNASSPALVVISQSYYHLWQASVDGNPTPLLRANLAFQAMQVPAGVHHLKLVYRDPYLKTGVVISALSLLMCALIWKSKAPAP